MDEISVSLFTNGGVICDFEALNFQSSGNQINNGKAAPGYT